VPRPLTADTNSQHWTLEKGEHDDLTTARSALPTCCSEPHVRGNTGNGDRLPGHHDFIGFGRHHDDDIADNYDNRNHYNHYNHPSWY
jgi:hypothetical protein